MRAWFVARTKPRREFQACDVLARRGLDVYLPQVPSRRCDRAGSRGLEPLFPGYLFCRLALGTAEWVVARSAPGVVHFLGAGGVPSALPDEVVEAIRSRVEALRRDGWPSPFRAGDHVLIARGPLAGLEAVFDRHLSPRGRARVFLEMVSRLVPIEIDVSMLRKAG
ncbi:MAG TPA: transcription termination/antitermination NusG family protein [Chloroflexota bacterium]|uniref:NusG-like N-terminal domain-containing protein n=1 Tax=Thermorudis sp. TaxID=1969470 RepID=A0A7C2WIV4_9BACT